MERAQRNRELERSNEEHRRELERQQHHMVIVHQKEVDEAKVGTAQSWALSAFFNFFNNKKWFFYILYKASNLFLHPSNLKSQINMLKNANNHFLLLKIFKNTESAQLWRSENDAARWRGSIAEQSGGKKFAKLKLKWPKLGIAHSRPSLLRNSLYFLGSQVDTAVSHFSCTNSYNECRTAWAQVVKQARNWVSKLLWTEP